MRSFCLRYFSIYSLGLLITIAFCQSCQNSKSLSKENKGNHLIHETSPYLLQHAHNPVDWYPWNDESLSLVKTKRKLMIISIGYSSCHWCHVMERESFSDTAVSNFMNEHFISIKVDREERPDIDQVYMNACQIANENGICGWPLNVLAMSDGRPFWVGTYLTKNDWLRLLKDFIMLYHEDPNELEKMANNIKNHLAVDYSRFSTSQDTSINEKYYLEAMKQMLQSMDMELGGKKGELKFPLPALHNCILEYGSNYKDKSALSFINLSLNKMALSGINDVLEGGFCRYSTDPIWKVPHFEKMLYDNAQLISLYSLAYQYSQNDLYKKTVEQTIDFVQRNLTNNAGYFYSSLDAETEGEEGKYYVLSYLELNNILKDEKEKLIFSKVFDISDKGNWEKGKNVLHRVVSNDQLANELKISTKEVDKILESAKQKVKEYKQIRSKPGVDDKMLTAWNALMIKSLADASAALQDPKYLDMAVRSAQFIISNMLQKDNSLLRTHKNSKSSVNGFLEDYAFTADAFIRLYELTFDQKYLDISKKLCDYVQANFSAGDHIYFYINSSLDKQLVTRNVEFEDQVMPSPNSVMADVLYKLGLYYYNQEYLSRSKQMVGNVMEHFVSKGAVYYCNWVRVYRHFIKPMYEVAIVGPESNALRNNLSKNYLTNVILLGGTTEGTLELLKDKLQEGNTFIYVCRNKVCKLPVKDPKQALELMK